MTRKLKILIVDDEPGLIRVVRLMLESTGRYEVAEELEALNALETAKRFQPDLVLLDLVMPKVDGGVVASQIRSDPHLAETPILFLSAMVLKRQSGPTEIDGCPALSKPIGLRELTEAIDARLHVVA